MTAIAFDTLEFAKRLRTANFTNEQAEAMAGAIAGIVAEQLASKADVTEVSRDLVDVKEDLSRDISDVKEELSREIADVKEELSRDIAAVKEELSREIADLRQEMHRGLADIRNSMKELEYRLTIRLGVMLAAAIAVIAALVKLL